MADRIRRHTRRSQAIEEKLPVTEAQRAAAITAVLDAEPMSVPEDPRALRDELDDARTRGRA